MLRQLFRTRGAYNVVNLPVAASQDDPGRADYSADWRHHATFAQPESDVGRKSHTQIQPLVCGFGDTTVYFILLLCL